MKKFFIFLLLIIHLNTFAFTKGVKGGMNYTIPQPLSGYENNFSGNFGYTFGGFLSFNLIDKLFLNTELMLNSWQFEYKTANGYGELVDGSSDYKTLDFGLMLSYNIFNNIYLSFGGFYGFPTAYKVYDEKGNSGYFGYDLKLPAVGFLFAISYKYNNLLFDFRYLYNKGPFLDKSGFEESCEIMKDEEGCQQDKFHQFQLLVGYEF